MRFFVFGLLSLLLNACSTPQLPITQQSHERAAKLQQQNKGLTSWDLTASTSLTTKQSSYPLTVYWQQNKDQYKLRFDAPFTTGVLHIKGHLGFAKLTLENKKTFQGANPEQLIAEITPFNIPITGLTQWIKGIAHAKTPHTLNINANGDTQTIVQDGWFIEYDDWQTQSINAIDYRLPNQVYLKHDDLEIKISPSQWVKPTVIKSNPLFSDLDF